MLRKQVLDKFDVINVFNGNSKLSERLVFDVFLFMWMIPSLNRMTLEN